MGMQASRGMEKGGDENGEVKIAAGNRGEVTATVTAATFVGDLDIGRKIVLIGGSKGLAD